MSSSVLGYSFIVILYITEKLHLHKIKDKLHLASYGAPFKISQPGHFN